MKEASPERAARAVAAGMAAMLLGGSLAMAEEPSAYAQDRYVQATFNVENTGNEPVTNAGFWCYAPMWQTPLQKTVRVTTNPESKVLGDERGIQILYFAITNLPPFGTKILQVEAELKYAGEPQALAEGPLDVFLRPEPYVESEAPEIRELAATIQPEGRHAMAHQIFKWIAANVEYMGYEPEDLGALWALRNKKGDCTEQSYLFTALCRACGIPARMMAGYLCERNCRLDPNSFHNWAEYYDGERWQLVDMQFGDFESRAPRYVATRVFAGAQAPGFQRFRVAGKGVKATMQGAK